jgi:hypothetical protein
MKRCLLKVDEMAVHSVRSVKMLNRRRPTHSQKVEYARESLRCTSPRSKETAKRHSLDGIGRQILRFVE